MMKKVFATIVPFFFSFLFLFLSVPDTNVFAEADEEKILVAFGDSLTYGYTVDGNSYAKIYAEKEGYTLENHAVVGMTSAELLAFLSYNMVSINHQGKTAYVNERLAELIFVRVTGKLF